jgi:hypothetical protein
MRKFNLLFAILFCNFLHAQTKISAYEQLASVNEQWKCQTDLSTQLKNTEAKPLVEQQLVQFHLQETELLLRSRDVSNLSTSLQKQRAKNLNILHGYWKCGLFPINDMHEGRQPYFIDKNNTYCAVGYLMQRTGADDIAKDVKATQNYSYLKDITHPKLMDWVAHSGLNIDELALIQPTYGGEFPPRLLEMHYNNTGVDVNEYIEIKQGNYLPRFNTVLFYNQNNTLYKTLHTSQMQFAGGYNDGFYHYTFQNTESFTDAGYIELRNTGTFNTNPPINYSDLISIVTYTSSSVVVNSNPMGTLSAISTYNIGENESTAIGSSLSFCGLYPDFANSSGTWNLLNQTNSMGVISSCVTFPTVVPVTLSKFDYLLKNNTVALQWQTENEINSSHFEIERSTDGVNFERIGKVLAAGASATSKQYNFVDENPKYINHYRLKLVDLDATSTYSKILFVKVQQASAIKVIENPVKDNLPLNITINASKIKNITLFDFMGRQLKTIKPFSGFQNVDIANLASGKYLVQLITTDGEGYNTAFIKAK